MAGKDMVRRGKYISTKFLSKTEKCIFRILLFLFNCSYILLTRELCASEVPRLLLPMALLQL